MHNLTASFVLGYHGCDKAVGEKLLNGERFRPSENDYDWLGSGVYFWEANPDRALDWAKQLTLRKKASSGIDLEPFVVGAVVNLAGELHLEFDSAMKGTGFSPYIHGPRLVWL